jgi:hypothetical protein
VAQRQRLHFVPPLLQAFKVQGAKAWQMEWAERPTIPAEQFQERAKEGQEDKQALCSLL